jgi:hypothetical protein
MKWPAIWTDQTTGLTDFSTAMLPENPSAVVHLDDARTCVRHKTGQQAPGASVPAPPVVSRALWFLECAAVSLLIDLGWELEPHDPNRSGLTPPRGHWTGLGGQR